MKQCQLCNKEFEKLSKSHIIPKFLFKSLKGDKGNEKVMKILPNQNYKKSYSADEFYDKSILCSFCETRLSKYETYLQIFLFEKIKSPIITESIGGYDLLHIDNINSLLLKIGLLSILWRSHITSHSFFKIVDLGIHGDKLKELIYDSETIEKYDYPILISVSNDDDMNEIVLPIEKNKDNGLTQYKFTIDRFRIVFFVGSVDCTRKAIPNDFILDSSNTIKILRYKKGFFYDLFSSFYLLDDKLRPKLK